MAGQTQDDTIKGTYYGDQQAFWKSKMILSQKHDSNKCWLRTDLVPDNKSGVFTSIPHGQPHIPGCSQQPQWWTGTNLNTSIFLVAWNFHTQSLLTSQPTSRNLGIFKPPHPFPMTLHKLTVTSRPEVDLTYYCWDVGMWGHGGVGTEVGGRQKTPQ